MTWFGGKSRVAPIVWQALGNPMNFVEPFFGSGAVLLGRPHAPGIETVNDKFSMICNFWRAVKHDPETVAHYADTPVMESELHARHIWLVHQLDTLVPKLEGDPEYYDAKIAGYWVYGMCCWIGGEFCSGKGPWQLDDESQLVHIGDAGRGIYRRLVYLSSAGRGIQRRLVHLGNAGRGIQRKRSDSILTWMHALSARLARVRVCCGDWTRVLGPSLTMKNVLTGVLLDPPYSEDLRGTVYTSETGGVAKDVAKWAIENGNDPCMRIVLCGYAGEHEMPSNWREVAWKAHGGYAHLGNGRGKENAAKERLWLSPHCLEVEDERQMTLF